MPPENEEKPEEEENQVEDAADLVSKENLEEARTEGPERAQ